MHLPVPRVGRLRHPVSTQTYCIPTDARESTPERRGMRCTSPVLTVAYFTHRDKYRRSEYSSVLWLLSSQGRRPSRPSPDRTGSLTVKRGTLCSAGTVQLQSYSQLGAYCAQVEPQTALGF